MVAHIVLPPGGSSFSLSAAVGGAAINRCAYVVEGGGVAFNGQAVAHNQFAKLRADVAVDLVNSHGTLTAEVLILQGRPIGEPVAQRGPFVMNTQQEIQEAYGTWRWGVSRFSRRVSCLTPKHVGRRLPTHAIWRLAMACRTSRVSA